MIQDSSHSKGLWENQKSFFSISIIIGSLPWWLSQTLPLSTGSCVGDFYFPCFESSHGPSSTIKEDCFVKLVEISQSSGLEGTKNDYLQNRQHEISQTWLLLLLSIWKVSHADCLFSVFLKIQESTLLTLSIEKLGSYTIATITARAPGQQM